jgi:protein-disulfide isomerase
MKRYLPLFLLCGLAAAQHPAHKPKSALDKATLEAYVRHLQLYMPNVKVAVSDPKPAPMTGFVEVTINASLGNASENRTFYVSKDGQKILVGSVYDVNTNPFKPDLDKLKTDFQPSIGTPGAPVVIVLFSDFQCQYCREEAKMIRAELIKNYSTQVRLYFKDFPLETIHPWAKPAAIAGRCVFKQTPTTFWDYHDWVFEKQGEITAENFNDKFTEFAQSKSLDAAQLNACRLAPPAAGDVDRSVAEGRSLGVNSTPTLFVNGRKIPYSITWENLKQVIEFEINYQRTAQNAGEACCTVTLPNPLAPPKP